jgi:hypothetical protein
MANDYNAGKPRATPRVPTNKKFNAASDAALNFLTAQPAWFHRDDLYDYARWFGAPATTRDTKAQILARIQTTVRARLHIQAGERLASASYFCPTCGCAWTVHAPDARCVAD